MDSSAIKALKEVLMFFKVKGIKYAISGINQKLEKRLKDSNVELMT